MRKVIAGGLEPAIYGPRPRRVTQLEPFEPYLGERLATVPELTGRRLHREVTALGYRGGYTAVTDLLREIRPVVPPPFELRFETPPGQQAQVDFTQFQTEFTDEPGVIHIVWLFSLVLGHSRMMWCRFVLHQDLPTVLRCHIAAFEALGGVPQQILYDRMKTAVIGDDAEAGHIIYNRTLLDFARHYGFLPKAYRPYRAKTKGKVERPFRYVRTVSTCSMRSLRTTTSSFTRTVLPIDGGYRPVGSQTLIFRSGTGEKTQRDTGPLHRRAPPGLVLRTATIWLSRVPVQAPRRRAASNGVSRPSTKLASAPELFADHVRMVRSITPRSMMSRFQYSGR